ncbi:MAG: hypothetical protein WBG02_10975 [Candidatus Acidiferrum sp.]
MAKKPTADEARLILELYNLRREAEMRKARQWWVAKFWPKTVDDYIRLGMVPGSEENNWLRQVLSYWGIGLSFVRTGILSEELFFDPSFCGELYFIYAKLRPILKGLREKTKNPEMLLSFEKTIQESKVARAHFAKMEPRVLAMWPKD